MLGLTPSVRIYLAREPTDMRKGIDGLSTLVRRHFDEDLFSGHFFLFLSRRRDRLKLIWWDHGGFFVAYKRLERGRFRRPYPDAEGNVVLTAAELQALLEGIDLSHAHRAKLWTPAHKRIDKSARI